MRTIIGTIFKIIGGIVFAICGIWGFLIEVAFIGAQFGFLGVVIGFMLFPVMFLAIPFYLGAVLGEWFLLTLIYGGGITAMIFFGIGTLIAGED